MLETNPSLPPMPAVQRGSPVGGDGDCRDRCEAEGVPQPSGWLGWLPGGPFRCARSTVQAWQSGQMAGH